MLSKAHTDALSAVKARDGVTARSERALRLKNELNLVLELVVHSREALQNELNTEFAQKKLSIDKTFLTKLKELTACFNSLTASRIQLDKAERAMEKEMTPQEEREAVFNFMASLTLDESYRLIHRMWDQHRARRSNQGLKSKELPDDAPDSE